MFSQGLHSLELLLLALVVFITLLAQAAQHIKIPYPILMVIGGLLLSLVPVFPNVSLNPALVFLVFLPPLLYSSALQVSWREFRANLFHILLLAFGGVVITVAGIAVGIHLLLPDYSLAAGAVLGAILGSTDAIAASAVARRVGLPQTLVELIEGESLMNDAAGLLALQFSVEMVSSRIAPSLLAGGGEFLLLIAAGAGSGLLVGVTISFLQRPLQGSAVQTLSGLATPYLAYLLGESLHGSGVLATIVCGLYIGRKSSETLTSAARLQSFAVWDTIEFGLNGLVFVLIGLQLPDVLSGVRPLHWFSLLSGALFIAVLLLLLRFLWIFPADWLARWHRSRRRHEPMAAANVRESVVVGWSGMRGVLTLAAALSLPVATNVGAPFPHRAGIIFLSFSAILISLTGQGLSLPWIIRRMRICASPRLLQEERWARRQLISKALEMVGSLRNESASEQRIALDLVDRFYQQRLAAVRGEEESNEPSAATQQRQYMQITAKLRALERAELNRLEIEGSIGGDTHRKLQRELDLLDLRFPAD